MDGHNLKQKLERFAPVHLHSSFDGLSQGDKAALRKLTEAGKLMDEIYFRQVWSGNVDMLKKLESSPNKETLDYFKLMFGPWSRLEDDEPFVEGVGKKPLGAGFYPEDITKEEFEKWLQELPAAEQERAKGFFHTIRRDAKGKLFTVPYSAEYREFLEPAARLLREAAALVSNASLKDYLEKRANSFISNEYYESDVAWMDVDSSSPLDITIGPYEVYEDRLFGYKAAFEGFICVRNQQESRNLEKYGSWLQMIEDSLPILPKYRNPKLGSSSPIVVVDEVLVGGERAGVQTAAFNLPNDEKVVEEKGSKRVMLKNVQQAKFESVLKPISKVLIEPSQQHLVAFEAFFTHVLLHELLHGLGPHKVFGTSSSIREKLQEIHSALEEAKADISGLWALQLLMDKNLLPKEHEATYYVTFLAGAFRSIRFGLEEAHGKGQALILSFLLQENAFEYLPTGTFKVNLELAKKATEKLSSIIMTIQAEGNKEEGLKLLEKYAKLDERVQNALNRISNIPVDIYPLFPTIPN